MANLYVREKGDIVTLQVIWESVKPPPRHISALVVDVSGHEERILYYQKIPSPRPRFTSFEMVHLKPVQRERIHPGLLRQGYVHSADLVHRGRVARERKAPPQDRLYALANLTGGRGTVKCNWRFDGIFVVFTIFVLLYYTHTMPMFNNFPFFFFYSVMLYRR